MASIVPKIKSGKPLQIQFKKPNQKCTISSLTTTLKKLIPNIKEIKITSKKLPKIINNKKLYVEQLKPSSVKKEQKTQVQVKPITEEITDNADIEYYPDKLKRKVDSKKIVLEPRHDYKVVATTNKRKRRTPKKDAGSLKKQKTSTRSPRTSSNDISFEDMIPSSIIHKIKDYKNTFYKNGPETDPITDPDPENDPTTDPDPENDPTTDPDPKNDPITDPGPKNTQKDAPDPETKSKLALKVTQRLKDPKSESGPQMEVMEELINEVSLTDEDFMEILTCPSPVWWEDPPDAYYTEESIGHFQKQDNLPQTEDCTIVPSKTTQPNAKTQNTPTELTAATNTFGNKELIEKRLKLENLLSSLKNNTVKTYKNKKLNNKKRKISSDGSELSVDGEDLIKSLESIEIPVKKQNIDKGNGIVRNFDEAKDATKRSLAKTNMNKSKNDEIQSKTDKTVINDTGIKNIDNDKNESKALNSPNIKATSPRKSNRLSPKKHQLPQYYNLKSKRPRIIKQNPRNKIVIDHHIKTNINSQKTPEKKSDRKPNDVSKIKKAYLDLLQHSKVSNNLTPEQEKNEPSAKEINTKENNKTNEINTKENTKITEENTKQNDNKEITEDSNPETLPNNKIKNENTKINNEIPIVLPKLTKIPKCLVVESPKSVNSVTSESTDINSEMDTISDTNIQYIDEYDGKKDELVTVYQILTKNDAMK